MIQIQSIYDELRTPTSQCKTNRDISTVGKRKGVRNREQVRNQSHMNKSLRDEPGDKLLYTVITSLTGKRIVP